MTIPDTGLLDEPTSPTILPETVAKKNPNTMMIIAPIRLTGTEGNSQIRSMMITVPAITIDIGRSLLVLTLTASL